MSEIRVKYKKPLKGLKEGEVGVISSKLTIHYPQNIGTNQVVYHSADAKDIEIVYDHRQQLEEIAEIVQFEIKESDGVEQIMEVLNRRVFCYLNQTKKR